MMRDVDAFRPFAVHADPQLTGIVRPVAVRPRYEPYGPSQEIAPPRQWTRTPPPMDRVYEWGYPPEQSPWEEEEGRWEEAPVPDRWTEGAPRVVRRPVKQIPTQLLRQYQQQQKQRERQQQQLMMQQRLREQLQEQLQHQLQQQYRRQQEEGQRSPRNGTHLPVSTRTSPTHFYLFFKLPSVHEEDVQVVVADDGSMVRVEGVREDGTPFRGTANLPDGVDCERATAHLDNGVLTIRLPLTESLGGSVCSESSESRIRMLDDEIESLCREREGMRNQQRSLAAIEEVEKRILAIRSVYEDDAFCPSSHGPHVKEARSKYRSKLLQALSALDSISTYGRDEIRARRKQAVCQVQQLVDALDTHIQRDDELESIRWRMATFHSDDHDKPTVTREVPLNMVTVAQREMAEPPAMSIVVSDEEGKVHEPSKVPVKGLPREDTDELRGWQVSETVDEGSAPCMGSDAGLPPRQDATTASSLQSVSSCDGFPRQDATTASSLQSVSSCDGFPRQDAMDLTMHSGRSDEASFPRQNTSTATIPPSSEELSGDGPFASTTDMREATSDSQISLMRTDGQPQSTTDTTSSDSQISLMRTDGQQHSQAGPSPCDGAAREEPPVEKVSVVAVPQVVHSKPHRSPRPAHPPTRKIHVKKWSERR